MDVETVQRFRFATDHGEVYAVAVRGDEEGPGRPTWKVGFAFCNPMDRGKPRKVRVELGYEIAEGRVRKGGSTIAFAYPADANREILQMVIVSHLLRAMTDSGLWGCLGARPYRGRGGDFMKWFRGKFADQFRERYAGNS